MERMEIKENIIKKEAVLYCKDNRRYEVIILYISCDFLEFLDKNSGKINLLSKSEISRIELNKGEKIQENTSQT